jgi:hypothetical protein
MVVSTKHTQSVDRIGAQAPARYLQEADGALLKINVAACIKKAYGQGSQIVFVKQILVFQVAKQLDCSLERILSNSTLDQTSPK